MNGVTKIDREAWLSAIDALQTPCHSDAITMREFAEMTGLKLTTAKTRMAALIKIGRATCVDKVITSTSGRPVRVAAYLLTPGTREQ